MPPEAASDSPTPQTAATDAPWLSVVIPSLNEGAMIGATLAALETAVLALESHPERRVEVILADGGSTDDTLRIATEFAGVRVVRSVPGRARQMNAGASAATAPRLLFLHADTRPDPDALRTLAEAMARQEASPRSAAPTLFTFEIGFRGDANSWRTMERGVAWRTRALGLPYGDQGFAMRRALFTRMGGFREDVAMEDLDFVLRLRGVCRIAMLPSVMRTSTRQWDRQGRVIGTMWNLLRLTGGLLLHYLRGEATVPPPDGGQRTPAA